MSQSIRWPQYVAGLSAAGGGFAVGTALGWSAPATSRLVKEQQYFPISEDEMSWIASIITLGCAISCLPIGMLMKKFGRKWTMLSLVVPFMVGWILVIWAQNFAMLLIGRLILGIAGGAFCVSAPQYSAEIGEKEIRGTLGSFFQLLVIAGILFVYIIGPLMTLFWTNIVCALIPLIFGAIFFFMPESPVYLLIEKRDDEAIAALKWLRGAAYDPSSEVETLKKVLFESEDEEISLKEALSKRSSIASIIISAGLMIFQQVSGINVVIFYSTVIFAAANTGINSDVSTIIVGAVHLAATFTASVIVDKAGRKLLLLISVATMTVTLVALGVFFFIQDSDADAAASLGWLPLTSLCVYIVAFALGYGPITWLMMSEVQAKEISSVVSPICGAFNWSLAFIITATFKMISDSIGIGETFWIFAGLSLIGTIFTVLVVPETKGKSMAEIQRMLSGEKTID